MRTASAVAVATLSILLVGTWGPAGRYLAAADIKVVDPQPQATAPESIPGVEDAMRFLKAGNAKRALERLTEVRSDHPELAEPHALMAQLYLLGNQLGPARQELERAVVADADAPEPYVLFGELALREQRVTDADCLFTRAWRYSQAFKKNAERQKSTSIRSQAGLATVAEIRGEWQPVIDHLTAWQKLDPDNAVIHQRLGRALFQLKKYKEALTELQTAAKEGKNMLPAEILMGQLYESAGDHKQAAQYMARAVKSAPDDLQARLAAAEWALRTNELAKAKAEAEAIAKIDADALGTSLLLGSIARVERKLPDAERHFQAAHLKSPGNFVATNSLALVLAEQPEEAKHKAALEFANMNSEKYAQNPEAWSTLAWVYFRLERYAEAERAMERALSARTLHPDSAFYLGTMLERRGKLEDARAVLEKALETPEAFAYRAEVTELLAKLNKQLKTAHDKDDVDLEKTPPAAAPPPATETPAPKAAPKPNR